MNGKRPIQIQGPEMHFKWWKKNSRCCTSKPANTSPPAPTRNLRRGSTSFWSTTYDRTVRTKSYNQVMMKMDVLAHLSSSSPTCSTAADDLDISLAADQLLQPSQSTVDNVLHNRSTSERPDIIRIAAEYFDSNQRASHLCGALIQSINEARTQCGDIKKMLLTMPQPVAGSDQIPGVLLQYMQANIDRFLGLARTRNPFGDDAMAIRMFDEVRERHNMISEEVAKRRRLVGREVRVLKKWKRGCTLGIVVGLVAGVVIIAVVAVVTHAIASVGAPILAAMATTRVHHHKQNQRNDERASGDKGEEGTGKVKWGIRKGYKRDLGVLRMQEEKLEALAKGSFTVRRMLDTLRCLLEGVQEDVERERRLVEFGWAHKEERLYMQQVGCHLYRSHLRLAQQLDNLEEQVVVGFLIINKARDWVLQEFSPSSC